MLAEQQMEKLALAEHPPTTVKEARARGDWPKWEEAMRKEIQKQLDMKIDVRVPRSEAPRGEILRSGWVFTYKLKVIDGESYIEGYKARDVVKGCSQKPGTYGDTFANTPRLAALKLLLAIAAAMGWDINLSDITLAYLNTHLDNPVFIEEAEGFEQSGPLGERMIRKTSTGKYGLMQGGHLWQKLKGEANEAANWKVTVADTQIFVLKDKAGKTVGIHGEHVDDGLNIGEKGVAAKYMSEMRKRFDIKDCTEKGLFLGCELSKDAAGNIYMNQSGYITQLAKKVGIDLLSEELFETPLPPFLKLPKDDETSLLDSAESEKYASDMGAVIYTLTTRPDIAHAASLLSKRTTTPTQLHRKLLDRVVGYLYQTRELGLRFEHGIPVILEAHADASFKDCAKTSRSTGGYTVNLRGSASIHAKSKLQNTIALSTMEAEMIQLSLACQFVIWARNFLEEIGFLQKLPTVLMEDNEAAVNIDGAAAKKAGFTH